MEEEAFLKLQPPYTMMVSGQTGSGKTMFVDKLIRTHHETHTKPFDRIVYAYSMMQPAYLSLQAQVPQVELSEGFPEQVDDSNKSTLLVLDDLMLELENDKRLAVAFTKMRHLNVSVIYIVQNLYHKSRYARDISLNLHYLVTFPNPRDSGMIMTLGRQVFPKTPGFLPDAFAQATSRPYGYLFMDLKSHTDPRFRVRERVLPDEQPTRVFLPK